MDFTGAFSLKNLIYYRLIGHFCLNSNPHTFGSTLKNRLFAFLTARNGEEKRDNDDTLWFHKLFTLGAPSRWHPDCELVPNQQWHGNFQLITTTSTWKKCRCTKVPSVFGWRPCSPPTGRNPEKSDPHIRKVERVHRMAKKKTVKNASSLSPWNLTFESLKFFVAPRVTEWTSED